MPIPKSILVAGVACAALLAVLAAIWYWPASPSAVQVPGSGTSGPAPTTVVVNVVDWTTDYLTTNNSSDTSYLTTPLCYPTRMPECPPQPGYLIVPACPGTGCYNVTPRSTILYNLTLIDNDTAAHRVESITVATPFSLVSVSPTLPVTLAPRTAGTTFAVQIETPPTAGFYNFTGLVDTS